MRGKLAIVLLIVFFASPLAAKELTGTLQGIKKSGQIRIGYRESQPPMSFSDKDGNPAGYSIDICKNISRLKSQLLQSICKLSVKLCATCAQTT